MSPSPIACDSRIQRVTVYARGAVVARRLSLPPELPEDAADLAVSGVTALAEPGSLRAVADSDRAIVALRSRFVLPKPPVTGGSLAERVVEHRLKRERLQGLWNHLKARRHLLDSITLDPSMASQWRRVDPSARVGDALALSKLLSSEIEALDRRIQETALAIERADREREADELAAAQARSSELDGEARPSLDVTLRLAPGGSQAVRTLEIEYVIQAARWFPAYTARFSAGATRVDWSIEALIAQASGEDWTHVELALATADLVTDARLPELASLRLGRAQPPARKGYRPAPEGLAALFEGYDRFVDAAPPKAPSGRVSSRSGRGGLMRGAPTTATLTAHPEPSLQREEPDADDDGADMQTLASLASVRAKSGAAQGYRGAPTSALEEYAAGDALGAPPAFGAPPPLGGGGGGMPPPPGAAPSFSVGMPAPPMQMAMPSAAMPPRPPRARAAAPQAKGMAQSRSSFAHDDDEGGAQSPSWESDVPAAIEPDDAWLDFDALRLSDPADRASRGRLVREDASGDGARRAAGAAVRSAREAIHLITPPAHVKDPRDGRGYFDYRYDAEGLADIPSNCRFHRVPVAAKRAPAAPRFITVPRESAEVFREVEIRNPFQAPLLAGPVEVFVDGALLTQSAIAHVDQGGDLLLGLGVEDRLRVARNARAVEGSAGLLGGSTTVDHTITIDLSSSLGRDVDVIVIDRVPVTDDKDVEIKTISTKPAGEVYTQAERGDPIRRGMRWRVPVPAGGKSKVELAYRITLPSKSEIVGGNRREG